MILLVKPEQHQEKPTTRRASQQVNQMAANELPVLMTVQAPRSARMLFRIVLAITIVTPLLLGFVPWQQNIPARGRLVAFDPLFRQQTVESPVSGKVIFSNVTEGSFVRKGDLLIRIEDQDPDYLRRLEQQAEAAGTELNLKQDKREALNLALEALEAAARSSIMSAEREYESALAEVSATQREVSVAQADYTQKELDYARQLKLFKEGLTSELKVQEKERDMIAAEQKVHAADDKVKSAQAKADGKKADIEAKRREWDAKIQEAIGKRDEAGAQVASSIKSLTDAESKVQRQRTQEVLAPIDGQVLRIHVGVGTHLIKQGDPLLDIIPDTDAFAVELWVSGNDAPLISKGRPVRLQFEGWPALQFAGWPSVAVGTFGGEISLVDAQDDGQGRFRVLVTPESNVSASWPDKSMLRQGVRANGWVLLDQVPLGYEIWRQLNGFPPALHEVKEKMEGSRDVVKIKSGK